MTSFAYMGNPNLKRVGTTFEYPQHLVEEYERCMDDPIYFAEKYIKIVTVDRGLIPIELFDYQKELIEAFKDNNRLILTTARQMGKTTAAVVLILHFILFNEHKEVALLSNKLAGATEILSRIRIAYEALPLWLQQNVVAWNKSTVELANGCKVYAAASSSSSIRGRSVALLYIDECAFIPNWDDFSNSVLPVIASGKSAKLLYTSTPNGLNHYYYTWDAALKGENDFVAIAADWTRHPDRDENWKKKTLADMNFDEMRFAQEYELEFIGSSGTLLSGAVLKSLRPSNPILMNANEGFKQFVKPEPGKIYVLIADVSEGKGLDYSTFSIIDVSTMPYNQVFTFRNNMLGTMDFAQVIYQFANLYNGAYVMVEINNMGVQVADSLLLEYGYENLIMTKAAGKTGKRITGGFGGGQVDRGIRTTKTVKATGCSLVKMLIEQKQLHINDSDTITEFNTFSKKSQSYEAEEGKHDDMVMPLVLFGWMTADPFFKEITNINTLEHLRERTNSEILESVLPFGYIQNANSDAFPLDPLV